MDAPGYLAPPRDAVFVDYVASTSQVPGGEARVLVPNNAPLIVPGSRELRLAGVGFGSLEPAGLVFASYELLRDGNPLDAFYGNPVAVGTLDAPGFVLTTPRARFKSDSTVMPGRGSSTR